VNAAGYLGSALRGVFGDRTWLQKTLVIALVGLMPFVGAFLILGYYMVLMRKTAWGGNRLPGLSDVREILSRGLDGFVVTLVWTLVLIVPLLFLLVIGMALLAPDSVFADGQAAYPEQLIWIMMIVIIPVSVFSNVAILRAAIYCDMSAGLRLSGIRDVIERCPSGFWRVTGLMVLLTVLNTLLNSLATYPAQWMNLDTWSALVVDSASSFLLSIPSIPLMLVLHFAYGLWGRNTDPSSWPPLLRQAQPAASEASDLWWDEDAADPNLTRETAAP